VVHRFLTYAIELSPPARAYVEAMQALPAFRQWTQEGLAETLLIPRFEQD
jgi:glutathione S-transferase